MIDGCYDCKLPAYLLWCQMMADSTMTTVRRTSTAAMATPTTSAQVPDEVWSSGDNNTIVVETDHTITAQYLQLSLPLLGMDTWVFHLE